MSSEQIRAARKRKQIEIDEEVDFYHRLEEEKRAALLEDFIRDHMELVRQQTVETWEREYPSRTHQWMIYIRNPTRALVDAVEDAVRINVEQTRARVQGTDYVVVRAQMDEKVTEDELAELLPSTDIFVSQLTLPYELRLNDVGLTELLTVELLGQANMIEIPEEEAWEVEHQADLEAEEPDPELYQ